MSISAQRTEAHSAMSFTKQGNFVRLLKGKHASGGSTATERRPVTVGFSTDRGRRANSSEWVATHRITVRIVRATLTELGWDTNQYFDVHEGTGGSAGKMLLTPAERPETGYKLSINNNDRIQERSDGYMAIGVHSVQHHALPDDTQGAQPVKFQVFNGELLIDMPSWFKPKAAPQRVDYSEDSHEDDIAQGAQLCAPRAVASDNGQPIKRGRGRPRKLPPHPNMIEGK